MQPARALPELGDDFAEVCAVSLEECFRRILTVNADRIALYHDLAARHAALAQWIEALDNDRIQSGNNSR